MMAVVPHTRVLAWQGVLWRAHEAGIGNTTDRWQDKEARCARLFGRVFSEGYVTNWRCARARCSLWQQRSANKFNTIVRCAGLWS
jgi:hypothetical protein